MVGSERGLAVARPRSKLRSMAAADTPLDRWLAPAGSRPFLAHDYRQRPRLARGAASRELPLASWETVDRLVSETPCDRLLARDGELWSGPAPRTPASWRAAFADGYTVVLRHAQLHDPGLAGLGRSLAMDLLGTISLQLYATPAGRGSFGWHYDPEEVFFLQTIGRKRVRLRENTQDPAPLLETMSRPGVFARETGPVEELVLGPGDLVYIPGGMWHEMTALDDSLSISLGIEAPTFLGLLDSLRRELARDPRWRERLPVLGRAAGLSDEDRLSLAREIHDAVARGVSAHLTDEDRARRWLGESLAAGVRSSTVR